MKGKGAEGRGRRGRRGKNENTEYQSGTYHVLLRAPVMILCDNSPRWVILFCFTDGDLGTLSFQSYSLCCRFKHSVNHNSSHDHIMQPFTESDVRHGVKPRCPDEGNEAQRGEVTCPGSHRLCVKSQNPNPGLTPMC